MVRVLLAPAARRFSSIVGSENGWMYDIVTGMIELCPELYFTCVAETADALTCNHIEHYAIGRRRSEEIGGAALPLRIATATRRLGLLDRTDLVHHGLPFMPGRTYSVLAFQAARRNLPFVVGPIQSPLAFYGSDEASVRADMPQRTLAQVGSRTIARIAWPVISTAVSRLSDATLCSAQRVVAIDEPTRRLLIARGVLPERIRVIPPPLRMAADKLPLRNVDSDTVRVVTVGYLIERKAVNEVVTAVAHLAAAGIPVALDVVGDGPELPALRRLVGALPGGQSVRFHGWLERDALMNVLSSAHVYATMSRAESWGQAMVEAMALGLETVSAANDGACSLVATGAPVRLVGIGAVAELEAVLREWCSQTPALIESAGAAGIGWANSTVASPVVARQWCDVYRQAAEENAQALSIQG